MPVIGEPSTRTFAARCRPTTLSGAADDDWWAACSLLEEMNTVALEPGIVSRPAQKKLRGVGGSATTAAWLHLLVSQTVLDAVTRQGYAAVLKALPGRWLWAAQLLRNANELTIRMNEVACGWVHIFHVNFELETEVGSLNGLMW